MVIFIDHGNASASAYADLHAGGVNVIETALKEGNTAPFLSMGRGLHPLSSGSPEGGSATANANADLGFSVALGCYPVVTEIARSVDLNTLHALSRTCRQFRANLLQFRNQLVRETLRCHNDVLKNETTTRRSFVQCARDMVGECQRCAKIVCRNCTMKLPHTSVLKTRLRRLCPTCLSAPLAHHLPPHSLCGIPSPGAGLCSCETHVWLCRPCGQILRSEDTAHKRVWTWRTRHSTYLGGGLGTGIGGGSQGVVCGRGDMCLAAEDTEVEVDCDVDEWMEHYNHHHAPHVVVDARDARDDEGPGYLRQEIEGIGGVLKQKVKKWVRVGARVDEFDGEREAGGYLLKEASGDVRSWCPWCWRVVPGDAEMPAAA